jgi:hypothetical protein
MVHTEAAIVLWGRRTGTGGGNNDDDDDIKVIAAVAKDLSEKHKNGFAGKADAKTLVGVEKKNGDGLHRFHQIIQNGQKISPTTWI